MKINFIFPWAMSICMVTFQLSSAHPTHTVEWGIFQLRHFFDPKGEGLKNFPEFGKDMRMAEANAKKWKKRVYLATYPRSGNHWLRYLIEAATYQATSSVYRDPDPRHLSKIFPWGGYCCKHGYGGNCYYPQKGDMVVVKTHFPIIQASQFDKLTYTKTIRIVRHPLDAIYSFYIWMQNYQRLLPENKIPREILLKYMQSWLRFQQFWDDSENVLTIRYEDLYNNPAYYLRKIFEYIDVQVSQEAIERAVAKHPSVGGLFKHHSHYTSEDLSIIQEMLGSQMKIYGYELLPTFRSLP